MFKMASSFGPLFAIAFRPFATVTWIPKARPIISHGRLSSGHRDRNINIEIVE